uniref:DNA polymerase subunit gamma-1 n=1 Tax=Cacopsylla melanoneura TaxID=428564 RepID=A0A8D8WS17_9HEMI
MLMFRKSTLFCVKCNVNVKLLHNKNPSTFSSEPFEDMVTNKTVVKRFKVNEHNRYDRSQLEPVLEINKTPKHVYLETTNSSSKSGKLFPKKMEKCKSTPCISEKVVNKSSIKIPQAISSVENGSLSKVSKRPVSKSEVDHKKVASSRVSSADISNESKSRLHSSKNCEKEIAEDSEFRMNPFNIQLLSNNIYHQLFPNNENQTGDAKLIEKCLQDLKVHHLPSDLNKMTDVTLKLPPIENGDILHHFHTIGEQQAKPYRDLTLDLVKSGVPEIPTVWEKNAGWTRYAAGKSPEPVEYPLEDAFVFDVEVCVKEGDMPTLATAVSTKAWYTWISPDLIEKKTRVGTKRYTTDKLIPFESNSRTSGSRARPEFNKEKVVIGHNVSYDRARIKEQYWLTRTGLRFIDTLSLHVCVSGITRYQRSLLKSEQNLIDESWSTVSSLNSLSEVYKLYCKGILDKTDRNIFVEGTLEDIENNWHNLMTYCAKDTLATYNVMKELFPLFLERFPHPVTLAGMLELSTAFLPVNNNWLKYFHESCQTFNDLNVEMKSLLMDKCDQACSLLHDEKYKENLWLWDQDWAVKEIKLKKKAKVSTKKAQTESESAEQDVAEVDEFYERDRTGEELVEDEYVKRRRELVEKFEPLLQTKDRLPANSSYLIGYPEWYRKLCVKPQSPGKDQSKQEVIQHRINDKSEAWVPGPSLISNSMQITPKLLSLTWKSLPLHFIRGHGWGYLVPYATDIQVPDADRVPLGALQKLYDSINEQNACQANVCNAQEKLRDSVETNISFIDCSKSAKRMEVIGHILEKKKAAESAQALSNVSANDSMDSERKVGFIKLPHKDGDQLNVGNPLSRDFINKFSENSLAGVDIEAKKIIGISRMLSYWRNNHERVKKQFVVWLNKRDLPRRLTENSETETKDYGVILPQLIVAGTLTRRAVEATWMTASNAVGERVGSELRAMIQAPDGYSIIGADVDSQELWIASVIGDSHCAKEHGATPLGWMTLSGQKSNATDMHSVTAKAVGISRDHAKVINYARIYGAGERFAERLLKQFNPEMSQADAKSKARKMYSLTKGKRKYRLKDGLLPELVKRIYTKYEAREVCAAYNISFEGIFDKPHWHGGTESAMFNRLEEIATSLEPVTPFLNCRLSRALEPSSESDSKFIQTRINWVVQSGAVDFLHLMLVCMRWLGSSETRFVISIHDEIRYLVPDEERYEAALALHVTNLLTRAFCIRKLDMTDIPLSISFFSGVEIDKVLRKESDNDCKTPSNPYGLHKGYGIPPGEILDIYQTIERASGVIGTFKPTKKTRKSTTNNTNKMSS